MPDVRIDRHGPVWCIIIDRPEKMNSLDFDAHCELVEAWKAFDADADARVGMLATRAPLAIRYAKQVLRRTQRTMELGEALRAEVRSFHDLGQSRDLAEGTTAFAERRPAKLEGH